MGAATVVGLGWIVAARRLPYRDSAAVETSRSSGCYALVPEEACRVATLAILARLKSCLAPKARIVIAGFVRAVDCSARRQVSPRRSGKQRSPVGERDDACVGPRRGVLGH